MKKIFALILVLTLLSPIFSGVAFAESPSSWAEEEVNELKSTGYFDVNRFTEYQKPITRLEFIYFAARLFEIMSGEEIQVDSNISFSDTSDIWALKGSSLGITSGTGNGKFAPNTVLTREQFATMIIRTIQLGNLSLSKSSTYKFSDDNRISSWAKEAMYLAKENNILSGVGNDMSAPQQDATVEQSLILINRILKNYKGKNFTYNGKVNIIPYENIKDTSSTSSETSTVFAFDITYGEGIYTGEVENNIPHGYGIWTDSDGIEYVGTWINGFLNGQGALYDPSTGNRFVGEWKDSRPNGHGKVIGYDGTIIVGQWLNGEEVEGTLIEKNSISTTYEGVAYIGEVINNIPHGYGVLYIPNGDKYDRYEGEFIDGEYEGHGTYTSDDFKFVGEWKNDKYNGHAIVTYSNGHKYVGEYKDGSRNGQGTYIYSDESNYVGEWKDGSRDGQGTMIYPDGSKYIGEFKDNSRSGQGTRTYSSGSKYVGEFKDGSFNGQGTYTYDNGDTYVGEFKDGLMNGEGTMTYSNGNKYIGEWYNSYKHGQGMMIYYNGVVYEGEFKNSLQYGKATMTYPNGVKYSGVWKIGSWEGEVIFTAPDGTEKTGQWIDGKFVE